MSRLNPIRWIRSGMDRAFEGISKGLRKSEAWSSSGAWVPEIDVVEGDRDVTIRAELPGIDVKDLQISVQGQCLTLAGEKREERSSTEGSLSHSERWYGMFERVIPLPDGTDPEDVKAAFANGLLTLRFRKEHRPPARRIPVDTSASTPGQEPMEETTMRDTKLKNVMTKDVVFVRPDETVRDIACKMRDEDIGSFPVCEGERVVGMVTDRDLTIRVLAEGRDPAQTRAADVMTRDVICCGQERTVEEAQEAMEQHQIRRIPVVDEGQRLVGFFSIGKVARTADDSKTAEILESVTQSPRAKSA